MGAILLAKVQRERKYVHLDGTVRPGAVVPMEANSEVIVLAVTSMGHLADAASSIAIDLRRAGWTVDNEPYTFRGVPVTGGPRWDPRRLIAVILGEKVAPEPEPADDPTTIIERPMRRTRQYTVRRFRCDACGMEAALAGITKHQKAQDHEGRTYLETIVKRR